MSNSKRGKRRSQSSKKKTSLERFAEQKDQARGDEATGVDFFFLLMGMITTLMMFLLVYGVYSQTPKAARAAEAAKSGDPTKEVNATNAEEFDELLEGADVTQLTNILTGLNAWSAKDGAEKSITANQRRINVANHLLTKKLDNDQRRLAITSKLNALTTVYGFSLISSGVPNVAESLRDTSNTYLDSPDKDIQKLAKLSLFKVNAFEMTKDGNEPAPRQLVGEITKLLKSFPDDDSVLATVNMIVEYYRQKVDRNVARKVTMGLEAKKDEFSSDKVSQLIKDFSDQALLSDAKYTQLFDNRWLPGGQRELLKTTKQLAAEPSSGMLLVKSVDSVAHWFEQDDQYENAVAIYEEVLRSVDTYQSPEVAAQAKKRAQDGIQRSRIVGEKIDLSGFELNGEKMGGQEYEGKVVLVVFWSAFEPTSSAVLLKLSKSGKLWNQRGIRILAVNIDRKWNMDLIQGVVKAVSSVQFLFGDAGSNYSNEILDQCPSEIVPRLLLVKKDGRVADINVPADEIETQLDFLVGQ